MRPPFRIEAEPSTQYFSEWQFCYRVFEGEREVERWSGDYRTLPTGTLIQAADGLLKRIARDGAGTISIEKMAVAAL